MIIINPKNFFNYDEQVLFKFDQKLIDRKLEQFKGILKTLIPQLLEENKNGSEEVKKSKEKIQAFGHKTPIQTLIHIRKQLDAISTITQDHDVIRLYHLVTKIELQLNKKIQSRIKPIEDRVKKT